MSAIFEAPLLRGLDERGKHEVAQAGSVRRLAAEQRIYGEGESADTLFVVLSGEVHVLAPAEARAKTKLLRSVKRGAVFGEEACELGAVRLSRAVAAGACTLFELPISTFRRAALRCGAQAELEREERAFARAQLRDRLLALDLFDSERALELLLDGGNVLRPARGLTLYAAGDEANDAFLVLEGYVELLSGGERPRVERYFTPGDLFGHDELLSGRPRPARAVPLGSALLLRLPRALLDELTVCAPALLARAERHGTSLKRRLPLLNDADQRRTRLAVAELDRLAEARSLLAIDLDRCVRCGHCAWACASTHDGVTRLVREGAKVASRGAAGGERSLLLPNSCQHCVRPSCLPECPTGAIGRGADGEVFIRAELCTGCGACARACPWQNIQMVEREAAPALAVKCDLCAGLSGPACVNACPTGAITRASPELTFAELRALKEPGAEAAAPPAYVRARLVAGGALGVVVAALALLLALAPAPASGRVSYVTGAIAGLVALGLLAHAASKRRRPVRAERGGRERDRRPPQAKGKQRPSGAAWLRLHVVLGVFAPLAVVAHAGAARGGGVATALTLSFWACAALGVLGLALYRWLPARLTRLERRLVLPEHQPQARAELEDSLHSAVSQGGPLLKRLFERLLVAYLRSPLTTLGLLVSGRSLAEEEARLGRRLKPLLEKRSPAERSAISALLGGAVELAARPARSLLEGALRAIPVLHALLAAIFAVLLVLHVVGALR